MAKRVINRAELKAAAEAAEAARKKSERKRRPDDPPPVDPAFRALKLDDSLLNTYFSWCPAELMPEVAPTSRDPAVRGRLTLQMKQMGGLRELWELVGEVGWLVMDAVWLDSEPAEQYLVCGARTWQGQRPGRVVVPSHLWRLWQPSYSPHFRAIPESDASPSNEMHAAIEATLGTHLAESVKPWSDRTMKARRAKVEWEIETITARINELDAERRAVRRLPRKDQPNVSNRRRDLIEAESRLAELICGQDSTEPPTPTTVRQRLCEIHWIVQGPEQRRDFM
jgi:hypothetical protein